MNYEKIRKENEEAKMARISLFHKKYPQLKELDEEIENISKTLLQKAITGDFSPREKLEKLKEEKANFLKANKIKEYDKINYNCKYCLDTGVYNNSRCVCYTKNKINGLEDFLDFKIEYYPKEIQPKMIKVFKKAKEFAENFAENKKHENMLFYGSSGLGKTFLCNCITRKLLEKNVSVVSESAYNLFRYIEKERFEGEHKSIIEKYYNAPVLIIDDLGTEFSTIVTQSAFFNIINERMINKKSTIISTNLNPKELENSYSARVVSRFIGEYFMFGFEGIDIRIKKHKGIIN
ncbi:MAG: ATP-binding protein [Defluviitaleaceae bacterium]|nr:ATP-binding protein [Defluviitaleaceae bacterium]